MRAIHRWLDTLVAANKKTAVYDATVFAQVVQEIKDGLVVLDWRRQPLQYADRWLRTYIKDCMFVLHMGPKVEKVAYGLGRKLRILLAGLRRR